MSLPIENYALVGDCHTAALVGNDGSIDWLCLPRFDSGACFAALLGGPEHGRWLLAPAAPPTQVRRRYRGDTLILETEFDTAEGSVRVIDFMPLSDKRWDIVRIVEGLSGRVDMRMELGFRFDYGSIVPWAHRSQEVLLLTAGPDTLALSASVAIEGENMHSIAEFSVGAGERESFTLNYRPSHLDADEAIDAERELTETEARWKEWSGRGTYGGPWHATVARSLTAVKALTSKPTGGLIAAPTTSLPEWPGGTRNWDYRYCWLRDATFTLNALLLAGYEEEAAAWREWLLRAVAGSPDDLQILYGVTGVRRLDEYELAWLQGYEKSAPVRIGNAAAKQFQLDVYGEVMDTLHLARIAGLPPEAEAWKVQVALLKFLETHWELPVEGWWQTRAAIHAQVCEKGFDARRNSFVQSYDSAYLDASLLLIPQVGFLPADDPRVLGTIAAIERDLMADGLVLRYSTATKVDGLPAGEGTFLPCSFWLADCYILTGRREEGQALFERLLALGNDVGLFAEEYDPRDKRMLGNFPQALTHMALVNTARLLSMPEHEARGAAAKGERPTAAAISEPRS